MEKVLGTIERNTLGLAALDGLVGEKVKRGYIENSFKKLERAAIIPPCPKLPPRSPPTRQQMVPHQPVVAPPIISSQKHHATELLQELSQRQL
jgi:hypothetical protein